MFLIWPSSQDLNSHAGWGDAISRADDVVGINFEKRSYTPMMVLVLMTLPKVLVIGVMDLC